MKYFDYAATTPVDPAVYDAMQPYLTDCFYNASGLYSGGQRAKAAVEEARGAVMQALGASSGRLLFTSGGTESDNAALMGTASGSDSKRKTIAVSAIEHHAVLDTAAYLGKTGYKIRVLPVDRSGRVDMDACRAMIDEDVLIVSVMRANNELGVLQDIREIASISHRAGALFHTDAVQAFPHEDIRADSCGADLISVSSHKVSGPKGCGALWMRDGTPFSPFMHGGQQEEGLRGGTENIPAIAGFGKAASLLAEKREKRASYVSGLRDELLTILSGTDFLCNTDLSNSVPGILNIAFKDAEAEGMLFFLNREGFSLSMGSACTSRSVEPSHVIRAIGLPDAYKRGVIRISFGAENTEEDVKELGEALCRIYRNQREP